ncbi:Biphenyl-2,3-diol 1,2-dioxygenase 2 [Lachnellula cervina]|uniref:Biphenyl-2,3-diol 1,2-dioxygenase 2 n=1 Tax=Lachnellula cervina TaxID=1316786 RepID=A0A7D8YUJ7_9HELO|nr:Biphenyl-2,3-diol 1,2-dioxygenase 2 [Lachnellula cervina]
MGAQSLPDTGVLSPSSLAHVVLRTNNYRLMVEFYVNFLGGKIAYENEYLAFLTYDHEHHRIAILDVPNTNKKDKESCGLEHIAFSFDTLDDLVLSYQQRKKLGMLPVWCVNHGPTTSMYYEDPDGNQLETQVDNFDTVENTDQFMRSKAFGENPIGVDFRPEDLIKRLEAKEDHRSIKQRPNTGPRSLDSIPG